MSDTEESVQPPPEARSPLDAHLDAVEAALTRAGKSREARRAVTDDLEAQAMEMLAKLTGGRPATRSDMEELVLQLDPPEAYANATFVDAPRREAAKSVSPASSVDAAKRRRIMKALFLIAIIVCGTLLVMTPAISDHLSRRAVAEVLRQQEVTGEQGTASVSLGDAMQPLERFGCWITGSGMILAGIAGGLWSRNGLAGTATATREEQR